MSWIPVTELLKPLDFPELVGMPFVIQNEPFWTLPEFMLMKCLSAPHYHHLQGRGRGKDEIEVSHMANDLVSHAYTMESHIKILE